MPVMSGSVPDALKKATKMTNLAPKEQPRAIFKKLIESSRVTPLANM